ncbi:MAG: mechanosensitive ion channel family protein [Bacillales bacterium]|nr:mechanosensitive ion channel family protein [Bacillales bacterium]
MEKKKIKISSIISLSLGIIVLVAFVTIMILELALPADNVFSLWAKENVWDITQFPTLFMEHYKVLVHCIILIAVVIALSRLLRFIFRKIMNKSNRAKTVITLLDGLIKYGSAIALIFLVLNAFGVNTRAIWESVGVITLIIGLGCQSLIADIVAGVFIIFENEYDVGEIVSIDGFRGTVNEIGIRATKIIDAAGNIKIINNSDIKNVVNLSRELSLAIVDCEFTYDAPIELIEKILKDNLNSFKEKIPEIIEGPFYKGVSYYGASNIAVKLVAKCHEEDRYQVQRDILKEYRQLFLTYGIDLSYDQVVISQAVKQEFKTTKSVKKEASEFANEQKVLSEGLEEQVKE